MIESLIDKSNIKITEDSFKKCWLDLGALGNGGDALKVFNKKLSAYEEFRNYDKKFGYDNLTNTMAIKFIVCMYDTESPFSGIEDYHKRKLLSAEYAGFTAGETGILAEYAQAAMQGKIPIFNAMAITYCIIIHSPEYATYHRFLQKYYEDVIMDPKTTLAKAKVELAVLNELRDTILARDETGGIQREFYRTVTNAELEVRRYRPEYKAQEWITDFNTSHGLQKEKK